MNSKMNQHLIPVLLNIPEEVLAEIDSAVKLRNTSRTAFIKEAIVRNLAFFNEHERDILETLRDKKDEYYEMPIVF